MGGLRASLAVVIGLISSGAALAQPPACEMCAPPLRQEPRALSMEEIRSVVVARLGEMGRCVPRVTGGDRRSDVFRFEIEVSADGVPTRVVATNARRVRNRCLEGEIMTLRFRAGPTPARRVIYLRM